MPYIKPICRPPLDPIIDGLIARLDSLGANKGAVNYTITRIVLATLVKRPGVSYSTLSDAIAVLRDAADEIASRLMGAYEAEAQTVNGDLPEYRALEQAIGEKFEDSIVDPPLTQVAAGCFVSLQEEIKEAFDRR